MKDLNTVDFRQVVQGVISLVLLISCVALSATNREIPEWLTALTISYLSYWIGSQTVIHTTKTLANGDGLFASNKGAKVIQSAAGLDVAHTTSSGEDKA